MTFNPDYAYKTYKIMSPVETHYRHATCEEAGCLAYKNGWIYQKAELIRENLLYVVTHAGKRYREQEGPDGEIYLAFEPGQQCFQYRAHRVSLERPEIYIAGRGRGRAFDPRRASKFDRADQWVESFATHQEIIKSAFEGVL
ncbi:MAG TPA: hypothetical protein VMP68_08940 [Candidatus Eisenbacteria bacterium]|nr:hypothetical protein [Candidatus Eisenbacteria bacterium]